MVDSGVVTSSGTTDPEAPRPAARLRAARRSTARIPRVRAVVAWLVIPAIACTSLRGREESAGISPDELLAGTALGLTGDPPALVPEADILAVTPEMRAFLDKYVDRKASPDLKLHELALAIINSESFGVYYDDTTRTASETFRMKRGNCLSFSNLFVAMARDVGLNVQFQEVDIPPDWTFDKDTYVLNRHVDVYVDLALAGTRVVDFNMEDFKSTYDMRRISDGRALAHYYNNVGVARMQANDAAAALACFRRAIVDSGGDFSPAWTNLGTLYQRNGHAAHAEAAFLQALKVNEWDSVAMSNLAGLYERLGDRERAAAYQKKVLQHRWRNPYYRYQLAHQAYLAREYDAAIGHLRYAIRQRPREDSFYLLMGLSYLKKGDSEAARRWLTRAQEVAATDALKRRYSSKVDALLRGGSPPK